MKRKKLVVMGFMAGCPVAGVIWQHIHYIVGLQRLGHDVYYIEDSARYPYDPEGASFSGSFAHAAHVLDQLAREFGFEERWAFCARYATGFPTAGLSLKKIQRLYREADAILNVCGAQEMNDDLLASDGILYVESDPAVEQIKVDQGNAATIEYLRQHRKLFTFGENVGRADFPVPKHGFEWLPTRQPVVIDFWKTARTPPADALFTSVANWNTRGKDVTWRGETYLWSKAREFLRFIAAPRKAGERFELASGIKDAKTQSRFARNNWQLRDPTDISDDFKLYRQYLRRSKAEFTVAKDQYVRLRTGWFSDRSACYLAAGRPVIMQETGFTDHYGGEAGLFGFGSLGDIVEAVRAINGDYARHSRAARALAREVFDAEKVLRSLLERAGI
jgi:hypothetical protein